MSVGLATTSSSLLIAVLAALLCVSCTSNPVAPHCGFTTVSPICAPDGDVSRCRAVQHTMCGTTYDVTPQTTWSSSNPTIMVVSPEGVARSVTPGDVDVMATYSGGSGRARLRVLLGQPPLLRGDFTGPVRRAPGCTEGEPGVLVTFTSGIYPELSMTTDAGGRFSFVDIAFPPTFTLQLSKPGFQTLSISGLPGYPSGLPTPNPCISPIP